MSAVEKISGSAGLSDEIASRLEKWIVEQGLGPGAQLPTEKVLCARFGVSRAVIREAISRLKAEGCVRTRQGSGAYVAALPGAGSFRLVRPAVGVAEDLPRELSDVFELRYLMETGVAELAAVRHTPDDLKRMRIALDRMHAALDTMGDAVADDDAFHVAVAAATHNPQLERFQAFMGRQLSDSRAPTWNVAGHQAGRARQAQDEHEQIFAAIVSGDASAARKAAGDHLVRAANRLGLDPLRWSGVDDLESEK